MHRGVYFNFSSGCFITAILVNPPEKKLAKHTSVHCTNCCFMQRYTYRVLQTIQMKLILLCVLAELAFLGSTITAIKFIYEI